MPRTGRPRKEIDWKVFDALLGVQCNQEEVANHFNVSVDTIERAVKREHGVTYAEYSSQKKTAGLVSIRRKMFQIAMTGNPTMLIWVSKNWLGWSNNGWDDPLDDDLRPRGLTVVLDDGDDDAESAGPN